MNAAALAPGVIFANDFEIVRPLKAGGMGSVYVALQKSTGKQRALKVMLAQLVESADLRRRFDQEARIASLIESEHVVEVVGAGVDETSGVPWLAMELLEGADLDTAIADRGPLPLAEARRVLKELCHALSAAHTAGIIHRDLKPENIFLAASKRVEEGQIVKVLDFGIAKIAVEAATKNTGAMGSPIWMAPEQTEHGGVTAAADVWAIGLITFFMLTGRPFWVSANKEDGSVQQIMREVLFAPIPNATARANELDIGERLPAWFDGWFARCVTRDPLARLPNAREVFDLFDRLCDAPSHMITAAPSSAPVIVREVPSSGARWAAQGDGTTPVGPTIPAASDWPTVPATRAPGSRKTGEAAEKGRRTRPAFIIAGVLAIGMLGVGALGFRPRQTEAPRVPAPAAQSLGLPPELGSTPGAAWFGAVKPKCNPVEVELVVRRNPPPPGKDGAGFAAACFALAGKIDRARALLGALPEGERAWGAWAVFEVVHPIADAGDDPAAGPAMRLVLEYWPDNYMALYHAGMSEYEAREPAAARDHLTRFLAIYKRPDGFTESAKRVLAELSETPRGKKDCANPLTIDPEGRKVYRVGCEPKR